MNQKNSSRKKNRHRSKIKRKVIIGIVMPVMITLFIILGMFNALCSVFPSAAESMVDDYKKAADLAGCTWQELIVYDTVRFENELEDVNPYLSAVDFLKLYYEKYEWVRTDKGGYWELVSKGFLSTPQSICSWFKLSKDSDINQVLEASKKLKPPEYVIKFTSKDLDTLIVEKQFNEDQIEWVDMLMTSGILEEMFGDIYNLPDYIESAEGGYFAWPTPTLHTVTSKFASVRLHPVLGINRPHNGLDISGANAMGSPVIAIADGTVVMVDPDGGERGMNIKVQHNIGKDVWISRYQHLSAIKVSVGDHVQRGTVIAAVGNSGIGTGAHLHIELTYNGVLIDPLPLISSK